MDLNSWREKGPALPSRSRWLAAPFLALLVMTASCVPGGYSMAPPTALSAISIDIPMASEGDPAAPLVAEAQPLDLAALPVDAAVAANAALAIAGAPNPAARAFVARGRTAIDQMRSLDCLAQAVYYEARSESEDGQRAVAQVVLNRVRHPSWPGSVCGVVYQGPMRAGGGCQFTFTCDGSLEMRPIGPGWYRARRIAATALAGGTFAPVGHSTHYHTHQVFPHWAPRLSKTAVIGSHNFYRLPGDWGMPGAFRQTYAGTEPVARPAMRMATSAPALPFVPMIQHYPRLETVTAPDALPPVQYTEAGLPQSTVREEYRNSGQWRADAPMQVTGR